jgi:hypothetical protein
MFQRNLGWNRNKRDLTSSSTRQLLQNNMGEAFLEPSDSYFLFADLVGFYPH